MERLHAVTELDFSKDPALQRYLTGACFREELPDEGFSEDTNSVPASSTTDLASAAMETELEAYNYKLTALSTQRRMDNVIANSGGKANGIDLYKTTKYTNEMPPAVVTSWSVNGKIKSAIEDYGNVMQQTKRERQVEAVRRFTDKYHSPSNLRMQVVADSEHVRTSPTPSSVPHSTSLPAFSRTLPANGSGLNLPRSATIKSPYIASRARSGDRFGSYATTDDRKLQDPAHGSVKVVVDSPFIAARTRSRDRLGSHSRRDDTTVNVLLKPAESHHPLNDFQPSVITNNVSQLQVLTEHEIIQIDLFYRSHKTDIVVCQCMAEMYTGSSREKPHKLFDLSQWTLHKVGIPVLVLDSGESRRQRRLSLILAERGSGFALWKETVNHLTNYQTVLNNFHSLHLSKDHTKLVGFRFKDSIAASDFYHKYQAIINNPNDDILNLGTKSKKKRDKSKPPKARPKTPNKSDISLPCCFTHVTSMNRDDGLTTLRDAQI